MKKVAVISLIAVAMCATQAYANQVLRSAGAAAAGESAAGAAAAGAGIQAGGQTAAGVAGSAAAGASALRNTGRAGILGSSLAVGAAIVGMTCGSDSALAGQDQLKNTVTRAVQAGVLRSDDSCFQGASFEAAKRVTLAAEQATIAWEVNGEPQMSIKVEDLNKPQNLAGAVEARLAFTRSLADQIGTTLEDVHARIGSAAQPGYTLCSMDHGPNQAPGCWLSGGMCSKMVYDAVGRRLANNN